MFGILAWIIFGLIAGLIAKALMPGKDPGGCIVTTLLGIVGAVIGGFIGRSLLGYGRATDTMGDISKPGFLMSLLLAVIGAIIVLAVYRMVSRRNNRG
jgi:uncharacterized membrane protein YeaQ/YmgE (transglycosylase-associated protein family)